MLSYELQERIKRLLSRPKGDTEAIHIEYDEILMEIVKQYEPKILDELQLACGSDGFWYA